MSATRLRAAWQRVLEHLESGGADLNRELDPTESSRVKLAAAKCKCGDRVGVHTTVGCIDCDPCERDWIAALLSSGVRVR